MESIISEVAVGLIIAALSWIAGSLTTKLKKYKKQEEEDRQRTEIRRVAIEETCKETLRKMLKDDCDYFENLGYCSVDDKFEIQRIYKIYHDGLNGNGRGTRYYEIIMKLPDAPVNKSDIALG